MDAWKLRTGRRYAGICPGFAFLQHNPTILSNAQHKAHTQCDVSLQKGLRSMLTQMLWREHLVMCSEFNIILIVIIIIINAIGLRVDARLLSSYPFLTILFYFFLHFPSHFRSCFVENTPTQLCVLFDLRFWQLRNEANNANTVPGNRIRGRIRIEIGIGIGIGIGIS